MYSPGQPDSCPLTWRVGGLTIARRRRRVSRIVDFESCRNLRFKYLTGQFLGILAGDTARMNAQVEADATQVFVPNAFLRGLVK